jgi:hypothetical protein
MQAYRSRETRQQVHVHTRPVGELGLLPSFSQHLRVILNQNTTYIDRYVIFQGWRLPHSTTCSGLGPGPVVIGLGLRWGVCCDRVGWDFGGEFVAANRSCVIERVGV